MEGLIHEKAEEKVGEALREGNPNTHGSSFQGKRGETYAVSRTLDYRRVALLDNICMIPM